jgi:hypothetical protein
MDASPPASRLRIRRSTRSTVPSPSPQVAVHLDRKTRKPPWGLADSCCTHVLPLVRLLTLSHSQLVAAMALDPLRRLHGTARPHARIASTLSHVPRPLHAPRRRGRSRLAAAPRAVGCVARRRMPREGFASGQARRHDQLAVDAHCVAHLRREVGALSTRAAHTGPRTRHTASLTMAHARRDASAEWAGRARVAAHLRHKRDGIAAHWTVEAPPPQVVGAPEAQPCVSAVQ